MLTDEEIKEVYEYLLSIEGELTESLKRDGFKVTGSSLGENWSCHRWETKDNISTEDYANIVAIHAGHRRNYIEKLIKQLGVRL